MVSGGWRRVITESVAESKHSAWKLVDKAKFSRGFQHGVNYENYSETDSGECTALERSSGGLLLHWERGSASPALSQASTPETCDENMAPILVRILEEGKSLLFRSIYAETKEEERALFISIHETKWDARIR